MHRSRGQKCKKTGKTGLGSTVPGTIGLRGHSFRDHKFRDHKFRDHKSGDQTGSVPPTLEVTVVSATGPGTRAKGQKTINTG